MVVGVKQCDVLDLMRYIYTGCISIEANRMADMMDAAKKLNVVLPVHILSQQKPTASPLVQANPTVPQPMQQNHMRKSVVVSVSKKFVNDENTTPEVLHALGLQRRIRFTSTPAIQNKPPPMRKTPIYLNTTILRNEQPILVDDDDDEMEGENGRNIPITVCNNETQMIDPTKIIKKRVLRPNRKVDYEKLNTLDIKDEEDPEEMGQMVFCKYCDAPFANITRHMRACKQNPDQKSYKGNVRAQQRRKTMF